MASSSRRSSSTSHPRPSSGSGGSSARARLAAQREKEARRRRQLLIVAIPVAVVLVAVVALVVVRLVGRDDSAPVAGGGSGVVAAATSVPVTVLDQIGAGTATNPPKAIQAPALTADGKPEVLYVGAEYCPYCAAERWAVVVALSRFGTFSGLGQTASASRDVYPSTATLTFHGATFRSASVAFTGAELQSNELKDGQYAPLDTLSQADRDVYDTYDAPPYVEEANRGAFPFLAIGGKYISAGASYDPGVLKGQTHEQIAAALSDPNSEIAQAVDGSANLITAAVCASTDQQPADVCGSAGVKTAAARLS